MVWSAFVNKLPVTVLSTPGPFESWSALSAGLTPLLAEEVGAFFLPWSTANAAAIADGAKSFDVDLGGAIWSQEPQKYHSRSLAEIRRKYAEAKGAADLNEVLEKTGCLKWLVGATPGR